MKKIYQAPQMQEVKLAYKQHILEASIEISAEDAAVEKPTDESDQGIYYTL